MKRFTLLMSVACVVASASALDYSPVLKSRQTVEAGESVILPVAPRSLAATVDSKRDSRKKVASRADDAMVFYRPAENVWALGNSTNGWGYQGVTFQFASSVGDIVFNNLSTNASDFAWTYSEVGAFDEAAEDFIYSSSNEMDLVVKSGFGEMATPTLQSGDNTYKPEQVAEYICGGSAAYWFRTTEEKGTYGVSPYQNFGSKNPQGYTGALSYYFSYDVKGEYDPNFEGCPFNENGVFYRWQEDLEKEADGASVTDLAIKNYSFFIPKPASTYMMSRAWTALNVNATSDTQLVSYIYKVDEDGEIAEEPLAYGYAIITAGDNYMPVFQYVLLSEDGDELEDPIFIDSEIMITVEGFTGNEAITDMVPVGGYYPFDYNSYSAENYGLLVEPTLYVNFSLKLNGTPAETMQTYWGLYYYDQSNNPDGSMKDPDTVTLYSYHQMTIDATFPFIAVYDGDDNVIIPAEGGSVDVLLQSWFGYIAEFMAQGDYTLEAPEWLKVVIGDMDEQTGLNTLTVSAEASEAGREGDVVIEGLGSKFKLHVIQGEGNAVSSISIDKNAQYFDLQGRRVANPDKGIYIKKTANKAEKVIL